MRTKIYSLILMVLFTLSAAVSAWSATIGLQRDGNGAYYVNMPDVDATLTIPEGVTSFNVYDDGGLTGDYSYDINSVLTLVAPEGMLLQVFGRVVLDPSFSVWLDNDNFSCTRRHDAVVVENWVSSGSMLDISFNTERKGENPIRESGFNFTVLVIDPNQEHAVQVSPTMGGSVTASPTSAAFNTEVSLTATPVEGYWLAGINVADSEGNSVQVTGGTWLENNVATFNMPGRDAFVTPVFTNDMSNISINIPREGSSSLVIPEGMMSFKVYDDGGKSGAYSYNATGYLQLTAPAGSVIQVSGTMNASYQFAALTLFDGTSSDAKLLDAFHVPANGVSTNIGSYVSSGETLTLYFATTPHEENSQIYYYSGLDLTVTVLPAYPVTIAPVTGGSATSAVNAARAGQTVSLNVAPSEGFVLDGVVAYSNGTAIEVKFEKWGNSATFVMPEGAVSVTPVFTPISNLALNLPTSGTTSIAIPSGATSLKVYDDGGDQANYSDKANGYLQLTAPEGRVLRMTGTVSTEKTGTDYLMVYDGNAGSTILLEPFYSTRNGDADNMGTVVSSGRTLTLYFKSDKTMNYAGLDLTVTVENPSVPHSLSIAEVSGGSMTANATSVIPGTVVSLTATPSAGYMLMGIEFMDENGKLLRGIDGVSISGNSASFVMPAMNVSVTPVFSNKLTVEEGLFAKIPTTGSAVITLPAGVASLKVYDDGGVDGSSSLSANGILELIAPEGSMLSVSGAVSVPGESSGFYVREENNVALATVGSGMEDSIDVTSKRNKVVLEFTSGLGHGDVDLTVSVVTFRTITITQANGGVVSSTVSSAMPNAFVDLSVAPNEGYMLKEIRVEDFLGLLVPVEAETFSNEAHFVMPNANVRITPVFTNDFTDISVNMPASNTKIVNLLPGMTSLKVYDACGKDNTCAKENQKNTGYLVLNAPEGYLFEVTGNVTLRDIADVVSIDNGSSNPLSMRIDSYEEQTLDLGHLNSFGRSITISYESGKLSYGFETSADIDLTVSLVDAHLEHNISIDNPSVGGSIASAVTKAEMGATVALTATPAEGYILSAVNVVTPSGEMLSVVGGEWISGNAAEFTMPYSDVIVTPVFTNDLTNLYVDMSKSETKSVIIPAAVRSFKVYDNGGKNGNYQGYSDDILSLTAPEGFVVQVSGSMDAYNSRTYLEIYDALGTNQAKLMGKYLGVEDNAVTFAPITSSGKYMSFHFRSEGNDDRSGLDLTVNLFEASNALAVDVENPAEGGTLTALVSTSAPGNKIELTASPAAGYALVGVDVVDANAQTISAQLENDLFPQTASFIMPAANVTVTPVFSSDFSVAGGLSVNIPANGTKTINIPAGVQSFKVYDDGGKDAPYSRNADGTLELTAPAGYALQVAGNVDIYGGTYDNFYVYDGINSSSPVLTMTSTGSVGCVLSTGNSIKLKLTSSNYSYTQAGLDLVVTVVDLSVGHSVAINNPSEGGSVTGPVSIPYQPRRIAWAMKSSHTSPEPTSTSTSFSFSSIR